MEGINRFHPISIQSLQHSYLCKYICKYVCGCLNINFIYYTTLVWHQVTGYLYLLPVPVFRYLGGGESRGLTIIARIQQQMAILKKYQIVWLSHTKCSTFACRYSEWIYRECTKLRQINWQKHPTKASTQTDLYWNSCGTH